MNTMRSEIPSNLLVTNVMGKLRRQFVTYKSSQSDQMMLMQDGIFSALQGYSEAFQREEPTPQVQQAQRLSRCMICRCRSMIVF